MKTFKFFKRKFYTIKDKFPLKNKSAKAIFAGVTLGVALGYQAFNHDNLFHLSVNNDHITELPEKFYLGNQEFMEKESLFSKSFYLQSGGAIIPHDKKVEKGGEDAYFATRVAAGVADGVGGWASKGIDPGIYSSFLMHHCRVYVEEGNRDAMDILKYGWQLCKEIVGSSTAVIVVLNDDNIETLNLGDSGVLIMSPSDKKIKLRTKSQQSRFNAPYQLGYNNRYTPERGDRYTVKATNNDIIVIASDGLFDNLYDHEICQIIEEEEANGGDKNPILLARAIASAAYNVSKSKVKTPFQEEAARNGLEYLGGKEDDITVVVCRVKERNVSLFGFFSNFSFGK